MNKNTAIRQLINTALGISLGFVSTSTFAVENGRAISEAEYPAVKKLALGNRGSCTGTFIGPKTMLTAAHCVKFISDFSIEPESVTVDGTTATSFHMHPIFAAGRSNRNAYDVALVYFEDGAFPYLSVAQNGGVPSESVRILGYGLAHRTDESSHGVKRIGQATIHQAMYGQILLQCREGDSRCMLTNRGDSGGPVLNQRDEVIAVTGGQNPNDQTIEGQRTYNSGHVEVAGAEAAAVRDFLIRTVADRGLNVPSLESPH